MAPVTATSSSISILIILLILIVTTSSSSSSSSSLTLGSPELTEDPTPTPWPVQFHSTLVMDYNGSLQIIELWYDWVKGRNFNIIQDQLGKLLYDLEWNNGTSFLYTLESDDSKTKTKTKTKLECRTSHVEVGILRPNWLDGANYLGQKQVDGFLCNVWEKVDFIWYYEDVVTKRPVHWAFYTGRKAHVMTFEVGATLEDSKWQAPVYCFDKKQNKKKKKKKKDDDTTTTSTTADHDDSEEAGSAMASDFINGSLMEQRVLTLRGSRSSMPL